MTSEVGGARHRRVPVVAGARGFDHVGLTVPDLEAGVDFFVDGLGARELFRMHRSADGRSMGAERLGVDPGSLFSLAMLEMGRQRVELLQWWPARSSDAASPEAPPRTDALGGFHVAVEVDDVAEALSELQGIDGVTVLGGPMRFPSGATPGLTNVFVKAPWGMLIELVSWQED